MDKNTMTEKLKQAQALLSEVYDDPALDHEANSSLSCADSCIIEVLDFLNPKPIGRIYFKYFDPFLGAYREDDCPLLPNEAPDDTARATLARHFEFERRKLQFVKIDFIEGIKK